MGYTGYWAYGKLLNRRAWALYSRALEDLGKGKLREGRMGAETALRIMPEHPPSTRLLARIQAASGEPEAALATFQKLTDERQLTLNDLHLYASLASQKGENELAQRLAAAAAAAGDPAFPHLLQAKKHQREKKTTEAEAELRAAVAVDKTETSKIALLDFLVANPRFGQSNLEIAIIIQEFSQRDDALGANALALGLRTGLMNPESRGEWIAKLRTHPKANAGHRLLADSTALAINPNAKSEIAATLAKDFQSRPLPARVAAARWLVTHREHAHALSILPLDEAITQPAAFIVWLDATGLAGDWKGSLAALDRKDNPLPVRKTQLFRGFAYKNLKKMEESKKCFQAAVQGAEDDPEDFAFVTAYLLGSNETELFESNIAEVAKKPSLAPALFRLVYPGIKAQRDAAGSLRMLENLAVSSELARSIEFQNEIAHQSLLLDKQVVVKRIEKRVEENPEDLSSAATLALHHLKSGNRTAALALFNNYKPDVDARILPPRILIIYSAVLAANGNQELALKIASIIPLVAMSKQETQLLRELIKPAKK